MKMDKYFLVVAVILGLIAENDALGSSDSDAQANITTKRKREESTSQNLPSKQAYTASSKEINDRNTIKEILESYKVFSSEITEEMRLSIAEQFIGDTRAEIESKISAIKSSSTTFFPSKMPPGMYTKIFELLARMQSSEILAMSHAINGLGYFLTGIPNSTDYDYDALILAGIELGLGELQSRMQIMKDNMSTLFPGGISFEARVGITLKCFWVNENNELKTKILSIKRQVLPLLDIMGVTGGMRGDIINFYMNVWMKPDEIEERVKLIDNRFASIKEKRNNSETIKTYMLLSRDQFRKLSQNK